jgi:hypothetical protein
MAKDEPQSYGSGADWVKGTTGQQVHDPKASPPPRHAGFYENRHDSEDNAPPEGGVQPAEQDPDDSLAACATDDATSEAKKVNSHESGAKRDSYFRKRDYEG